jgi:hypothetical protein
MGHGLLDGHYDNIADAGIAALGPAEHLDARDPFGPGIVSDVEVGFNLNHGISS